MRRSPIFRAALFSFLASLAVFAVVVSADTLTLKDGTVIEGRVIPQGDKLWIKTATGETRTIPKSEIASHEKDPPPGAGNAAPASSGTNPRSAIGAGQSFSQVKLKADRVEVPLVAVGLWQTFLDNNPDSADAPAAKAQLEKWKKLEADAAEKINGKWVGGDDRRKLIAKVEGLIAEANTLIKGNQTLNGVKKLEEAVKLYPNSFEANFELGYIYLIQQNKQKYDQAIRSLEQAVKLRPNSAAALTNLAIAYNFRDRYDLAVETAYKAAKIEDNKEIVQNLVNTITHAPPLMLRNNNKVKAVVDEARLLASRHGVGPSDRFIYVRPDTKGEAGDPGAVAGDSAAPGVIGNGSGFLVSADGYILTNKHVVEEKDVMLMCRFTDGTQKQAEVVALDDVSDLALLKIKADPDKPLAFLKLAEADLPAPGTDCVTLGFPAGSLMNYNMQVTAGTVSSVAPREEYEVTLTAKATHGNSGGPLVDKHGHVIGIVSAGLTAYNETYGKALSAGQVRKFLAKHTDKYAPTTFDAGEPGEKNAPLNTESIYAQASPATLCILLVRGGPEAGK